MRIHFSSLDIGRAIERVIVHCVILFENPQIKKYFGRLNCRIKKSIDGTLA